MTGKERWGTHPRCWTIAIFQLTELNIKPANPPCVQYALARGNAKWRHKFCAERIRDAKMKNHLNAPCEKGEMVCIVCELAWETLMFLVDVAEKVVVVHHGRCNISNVLSFDSRCSLLRCRLRRFDYLLLVFFDVFLQHLNSQQPLTRFTMEIEIAFLDTSVYRELYSNPKFWEFR